MVNKWTYERRNWRKKGFKKKQAYAQDLLKRTTTAERRLWKYLNEQGWKGKFRGQWVRCGYILDFYFPCLELAIEVDGPYHKEEVDQLRDRNLLKSGIKTIRFTNAQVMEQVDWVIERIKQAMKERMKDLGFRRLDGYF